MLSISDVDLEEKMHEVEPTPETKVRGKFKKIRVKRTVLSDFFQPLHKRAKAKPIPEDTFQNPTIANSDN